MAPVTLEGHAGGVGPIGISPDGKTLAACSIRSHGSAEILLWHTAEDETAAAAQGHVPSTNPAHCESPARRDRGLARVAELVRYRIGWTASILRKKPKSRRPIPWPPLPNLPGRPSRT